MAVSKVDAANQIENQLPQANIAGNVNFRNIIINGDMSLAQRGTEVTGITTSGYYTVDRFEINESTDGTFTMSQSTDVPSGQGFVKSSKLEATVADTPLTGTQSLRFLQKIEGQNLQYLKFGTSNAESLTLSFWVKSNKTGDYVARLLNLNSTQNRQVTGIFTINTSDTWEKKTITYAGDTSYGFDDGNTEELRLEIILGAGPDLTSGTQPTVWSNNTSTDSMVGQTVNLADTVGNEWYITGVQLEAGTTASDFEFLPRAVMESLCQRYFYIVTEIGIPGFLRADNNNSRDFYMPYKVTMRANPTITATTNTGTFDNTYPSTRQMWGRVTGGNDTANIFMEDDITFDAEL